MIRWSLKKFAHPILSYSVTRRRCFKLKLERHFVRLYMNSWKFPQSDSQNKLLSKKSTTTKQALTYIFSSLLFIFHIVACVSHFWERVKVAKKLFIVIAHTFLLKYIWFRLPFQSHRNERREISLFRKIH